MIRLVIPGRLPGLNEYIEAERNNRYKAAKLKRETELRIRMAAKSQLRGIRFNDPVIMHYAWYEPNRKRDKDNIAFARKFIQDALVRCGVLKNDGWGEISGFTDDFFVDAQNPRVEVRFDEAGMQKKITQFTNLNLKKIKGENKNDYFSCNSRSHCYYWMLCHHRSPEAI